MRVLELIPQFVLPADDGGKIGIFNIIKQFALQGVKLHILAFSEQIPEKKYLDEIRQYAEITFINQSVKNTKFKIAKSLITNSSIYINKYLSSKVYKEIDKLLKNNKFDVVHCDHSCMASLGVYIKKKYHIPFGIRLHNIEWMIWQRYAENLPSISLKRFYIQNQAFLLRNCEKQLYKDADICFAITENDRVRALELQPKSKVTVASAGVDIDIWNPDLDVQKESYTLLHATTYSWVHNVDAIKWFIKNVMPNLIKKYPNSTLTLLGKNPPQEFNEFKKLGVRSIGYVDDVKPYFNNTSIYIAPLFVGAGIRIKILEAMAMSIPVVATSISAEGIYAEENNGLFIVDTAEGFIECISYLFENPEKAVELGTKSREFVLNHFSWKTNVKTMIDEYKRIIS